MILYNLESLRRTIDASLCLFVRDLKFTYDHAILIVSLLLCACEQRDHPRFCFYFDLVFVALH